MNSSNYKKEQRSVLLTVAVGTKSQKGVMDDLPKGDIVFMGVVAKPVQDGLVRINVEKNGQTIVKPADVNWFDGGLGSFEQRALQISDQGGGRLDIYVDAIDAIETKDLQVEIIFQVWTRCS